MRSCYVVIVIAALGAMLACCAPGVCLGEFIVNGDFEDTTGWGAAGSTEFPAGWQATGSYKNPAEQASGTAAIGSSGTSAYLAAHYSNTDRWDMNQTFTTDSVWQFDIDFAAADPGGEDNRSFTILLQAASGAKIALRVVDVDDDGDGELQAYDKYVGTPSTRGWETIAGLESSVQFDADLSSDLAAHHMTIVGRFDEATPVYDITLTDPDSNVTTVTDIGFYDVSGPATGEGLALVSLYTWRSDGDCVVDNLSLVNVPEPGAAVGLLALLAGLGLARPRR